MAAKSVIDKLLGLIFYENINAAFNEIYFFLVKF